LGVRDTSRIGSLGSAPDGGYFVPFGSSWDQQSAPSQHDARFDTIIGLWNSTDGPGAPGPVDGNRSWGKPSGHEAQVREWAMRPHFCFSEIPIATGDVRPIRTAPVISRRTVANPDPREAHDHRRPRESPGLGDGYGSERLRGSIRALNVAAGLERGRSSRCAPGTGRLVPNAWSWAQPLRSISGSWTNASGYF